MYGGTGNDEVTAAAYPNTHAYAIMTGDNGDDKLTTYIHSAMYGGAGKDTLDATPANDPVIEVGDSGDDIIKGSQYADLIYGNADNDSLTGGNGADYFNCGPGTDSITDFDPTEGDVRTADCESY